MTKASPRFLISVFILSFFLACFSLSFNASAATDENESGFIKRETQAAKEIVDTARQSQQKKSLDGIKVTFKDILKDPDNVGLNFKYAQAQVAENDLLGAVGTLERILAVRPDLHEVRLFYAVVLFRLDNGVEAERELNALEKAPLSAPLRAEWKKYKYEIKLRKKKTRFSLRQSVGMEYDSNRNAAPSSKQLLFANTRIDNNVASRRKTDTSFLNISSVDVTHDLGFQAGHQLIGSFTYYLQNQQIVNSLDLGSFQYELGGVYKSKHFNFTPTFFASHVFLSDENYLRTQGGNFRFDRTFLEKFTGVVNYRIEHQDFLPISENAAARERTGVENSIATDLYYNFIPTMSLSAGFTYSYKNAKANYQGYDHYGIRTQHSWLLGKGQFLINGIEAGFDRYDEQDVAIATRFRRDKTLRYRLTYGAPLTFFLIGKILPSAFQDIILSVSYEYYRDISNITNYTYTNNKVQGLLTKKLEF